MVVLYQLDGSIIVGEQKQNNDGTLEYDLEFCYDSNDQILSMIHNGAEYYYIKNIQGDFVGIMDAAGTQVVTYTYDSWGKLLSVGGNTELGNKNPFRYRGYYYDDETGFYYVISRYYDPEVGRFISSDDVDYLGADGSLNIYNLYAYCYNNPVNMADDSGNIPFFVVTGIAGAVVGGIIGFAKTGSLKGTLAGAAIGGAIGLV